MSKGVKEFLYECFSENGRGSSKRVLACIMITVVLGVLITFSITDGCTENVKDIIELVIITAGALLGISNVTSIWKGQSKNSKNSDINFEEKEKIE